MTIFILYIFLFVVIIFYIVKLFNEAKLKKLSNTPNPLIKKSHLKLRSSDGASLLMIASSKNDSELVEKLLVDFNVNINETDYDNNNALIYAIKNNCEEVISLLIEHGVDLNIVNDSGESPIYFAITQNNGKLLELLINNRADIEFKSKKGFNFLKYAKFIEADKCIELLNSKNKKEVINKNNIDEISLYNKQAFAGYNENKNLKSIESEDKKAYKESIDYILLKKNIANILCPSCNNSLDNSLNFCTNCGLSLNDYKIDLKNQMTLHINNILNYKNKNIPIIICPSCESEINEKLKFCTKCGFNIDEHKYEIDLKLATNIAINEVNI